MEGLGRIFDIGNAVTPVDLDTANAATGKRIAMSVGRAVTFVLHAAAGAATDLVVDIQQHTAYTGGTSSDLESTVAGGGIVGSVAVDHYYIKSEAVLDNDEAWAKVAATADTSEITLTGATYGDKEYIAVFEVRDTMLAAGYSHVSLNLAATLSAAKLVAATYIVHELRYQRKPTRLRNLLRPSAVNA
jgi:hypothetical protein